MAKPTLTNFRADTLRELRVRAGRSQETVAEEVGVSSWDLPAVGKRGRATPLATRPPPLSRSCGRRTGGSGGFPAHVGRLPGPGRFRPGRPC